MAQVLSTVIPLFGLVLLGFLSAKWRPIPLDGLRWLNFFIVYIALPALFFKLLMVTPVAEFANITFLLCSTIATFAVFLICFSLAKVLRKASTPVAGIQGLAGAYGNIGYMGPPLAIATLGPEAGVPVALILCLENSMHFTLAPLLLSSDNNDQMGRLAFVGSILKKLFTHPFILACIAGVSAAFFEIQLPLAADNLLNSMANAAAPCALFAMGVTAALKPLKRVPVELNYLVPVKLLIHPLLVYFATSWIPGVPQYWVYAAVLLAALPTATNVFVIAQQYQLWEERASSAVVISTLLSTVSVTMIVYLIQAGII